VLLAVLAIGTALSVELAALAKAPFGRVATDRVAATATTLLLVVEITETKLELNIHPE
jgi:hypothetical protein